GVVANITVGRAPTGVAVDAAAGRVFVANNGSDNVSVLNASSHTVVASLPAGDGPVGVSVADPSGLAFVSNEASGNVTVINASRAVVVTTIPIVGPGIQPQGMAFDAASNQIWIGAGYFYAIVLNVSSLSVGGYVATDPSGVAYDSDTGKVCGTNTGNMSLFCVTTSFAPANLTFAETGLPAGTAWTVDLANGLASSDSSSVVFGVVPDVYSPAGSVSASYGVTTPAPYVPTPAGGTARFSASEESVVVNVTFVPMTGYSAVTFVASGLPAGDGWGVTLNGSVQTTETSTVRFYERNATALPFQITPPSGDRATPSNGTVSVAGSPVSVPISFSPRPAPTYPLTFVAVGLPPDTTWYLTLNGTLRDLNASTGSFRVVNGSYPYTVLAA
ncbi:thermopsin precursor, partial [mine drainage metagenome]